MTSLEGAPAQVSAVCAVHEPLPDPHGSVPWTAIDKRPVAGPVAVHALGVDGDLQCDRENHGGIHQAVYAYADEDAARWAGELGRDLPPGLFGENLRTRGMDVTGAEIGEVWRAGGVLLEVTAPRVPCRTFADWMAEPHWVKRFTQRGAPGAYLRVRQEGELCAGDRLEVVHRPGHGLSVGAVFLGADPAVMAGLLEVAERTGIDLSPSLRLRAEQAAARG
jgi:MOSC domain-containing protein YiiM